MSNIFSTSDMTDKMRNIKVDETVVFELKADVPFKKAMSSISAMAVRLGITIIQSGVKIVPVSSDGSNMICTNGIRVTRVLK